MTRQEFREIGFGLSYLARDSNLPQYFGDLFELIAFPDGDFMRIDERYANFCVDVPEKLGFVHQSRDEIERLNQDMKSLGLINPDSSG